MRSFLGRVSVPVFIVFLLIILIFGLIRYTNQFGPIPFNILSTNKDITSEGRGERIGSPDVVHISYGIFKEASTVEEAKKSADQVQQSMSKKLQQLGTLPEDIVINKEQILPKYENYQQIGDKAKIIGFMVNRHGEVTVRDLTKATAARDIILSSGASPYGGLIFVTSKEKQNSLMEEARKKAAEDAKSKAEKLAASSGLRLGRPVSVQENTAKYVDDRAIVYLVITYNTY